MPRPNYPSDHRRWFRICEDILDDTKLNGDCPADVFRFYFRLLAMLNRTKNRTGRITLDRRALMFCAVREQFRHALRVASEGAARELFTLRADGAQAVITVCNWSALQGFAPSPKTTPKTTPKTIRVEAPANAVAKKKPKAVRVKKPAASESAFALAKLLAHCLRERRPGAMVPPQLTGWARSIDKIDATADQIAGVIRWLYGPENEGEYRIEVQCGKALREKFGRCVAMWERKNAVVSMEAEINAQRKRLAERRRAQGNGGPRSLDRDSGADATGRGDRELPQEMRRVQRGNGGNGLQPLGG